MDRQISVFLLVILFTAGHSLNCHKCTNLTGSCADQTVINCPGESSKCTSSVTKIGDTITTVIKGCVVNDCQIWSYNFGTMKVSSSCCDTDFCNAQDAPDSISNEMKCYYCDGQSCSNTVSCSGSEDRCFKATGSYEGQSLVVKGCVSKAICNVTTSVPNVQDVSCCSGNLCNGAQSVTQSFLFLCCSLLSFILLH